MSERFEYRVDRNNVVISVSDNWETFAADNCGNASAMPEHVLGKPLEDAIADDDTRALYELVLNSVRRHNRPVVFEFRCDAPGERRFCEMRITPGDNGAVDFESTINRTELREPAILLQAEAPRSEKDFVKVCSACGRVPDEKGRWMELEQAIRHLNLTGRERMPRISHGLCEACHHRVLEAL